MSFAASFPKEAEMYRHHVSLYVYEPVIIQIFWPALTKFDRGVQITFSYKVAAHFL